MQIAASRTQLEEQRMIEERSKILIWKRLSELPRVRKGDLSTEWSSDGDLGFSLWRQKD